MMENSLRPLPDDERHRHANPMQEHTFSSWDGLRLFYRTWLPANEVKGALILFHGGHEHSGRFQDLVAGISGKNLAVFAWDSRGHGRSPGPRGYAHHFQDFVRDAESFIQHIVHTYAIPTSRMVLMGHSVGSVIAVAWLQDYARPVRGAILGSPAFHVKLYVPLALPALRLWQKLKPDAYVNSYVKPAFLTHDKHEAKARQYDELISPRIAVRVLTSLFTTANRLLKGAPTLRTPILIMSAGSDWVVKKSAHETFFKRLGSTQKILQCYPGFFHEIFHEQNRHIAIAEAQRFIEHLFETGAPHPPDKLNVKLASRQSHVSRWASRMKNLGYPLLKLGLASVGRLSTGVRLGWSTGFDSGTSLDYVYENKARGVTFLGRIIDRQYLDSVGWRRIRDRLENLEQLLESTIKRLREEEIDVHIVDLAAGPGRLVLRTLERIGDAKITAVCRDLSLDELRKAQQAAQSYHADTVRFEPGDAFDEASIAQLSPRPNIVIVSGLYELYSDNQQIRRSLIAIRRILRERGYLIYTNQPYHPQLELIAQTLVNRNQQPWRMRTRSQHEMNNLVSTCGFEPEQMLIDDDGIFSVTVARKRTELWAS